MCGRIIRSVTHQQNIGTLATYINCKIYKLTVLYFQGFNKVKPILQSILKYVSLILASPTVKCEFNASVQVCKYSWNCCLVNTVGLQSTFCNMKSCYCGFSLVNVL